MPYSHLRGMTKRVTIFSGQTGSKNNLLAPPRFLIIIRRTNFAALFTPPPNPRREAARKRALLARFAARASSATKIQAAWRGKMARDSYLRTRCSWLASREIQRMYRGHLGRRTTKRRREWQSAGPGPERLKLGLRMIEDTKVRGKERTSRTQTQREEGWRGAFPCGFACWDMVEAVIFLAALTAKGRGK